MAYDRRDTSGWWSWARQGAGDVRVIVGWLRWNVVLALLLAGSLAMAADNGKPLGSADQQRLDGLLAADDFDGAAQLIDQLAGRGTIDRDQRLRLQQQLLSSKTQRIIDYSRRIRQALAAGNYDQSHDYVQRLRALTVTKDEPGPASPDAPPAVASQPEPAAPPAPQAAPATTAALPAPPAALPAADDLDQTSQGQLQVARVAVASGRILPPAPDNAFALAAKRLDRAPRDPTGMQIRELVTDAIRRQTEQALAAGRYAEAMAPADGLLAALADPAAGAPSVWRRQWRDELSAWQAERFEATGRALLAGGEAAVERHDLTAAIGAARPAVAYLRDLQSLGGRDDGKALRLRGLILADYRQLIERRLAANETGSALGLIERMAAFAKAEQLPLAEVNELRTRTLVAEQRKADYQGLLATARQALERGNLLAPSGDNALEVATLASGLQPADPAAQALVDQILATERRRIDQLAAAGEAAAAATRAEQLAAALRRLELNRPAVVAALEQQAERLRRPPPPPVVAKPSAPAKASAPAVAAKPPATPVPAASAEAATVAADPPAAGEAASLPADPAPPIDLTPVPAAGPERTRAAPYTFINPF